MKFLKSLYNTLREYIQDFNKRNNPLSPTDNLGRFLTSSSHFSKNNDRVKHNALLPFKNPKTEVYETSVFNIQGLRKDKIKEIATTSILPNLGSNRSIYGTGITTPNHIDNIDLIAEASEPPERHLNIVGWPQEKHERKQLAIELASECKLSLFENKITS